MIGQQIAARKKTANISDLVLFQRASALSPSWMKEASPLMRTVSLNRLTSMLSSREFNIGFTKLPWSERRPIVDEAVPGKLD